jgi:hypothetical protein
MDRTNDKDEKDRIGLRVTAFSAMGKQNMLVWANFRNTLKILQFLATPGSRRYNEDFFSVAYQENDNAKDLDYAFFGIFDGYDFLK